MLVTIYADTTGLFTEEFLFNTNLIDLEISKTCLFTFFGDELIEDYRPGIDEDVSEYGLFEEWLDEYTADDTTELWEWCEKYGVECKIDRIYG